MVSTRSASSSPVKRALPSQTEHTSSSTSKQKPTGPPHPQNDPLRLLISPKDISHLARIIVLPNPTDKTSPNPTQKRFLFCPSAGLFELTKITVPQHDLRSILFSPSDTVARSHIPRDSLVPAKQPISSGYVSKQAAYMTATPFDVAFLLLPILATSDSTKPKSALFQSIDDILEDALSEDKHFMYVFSHARSIFDEAMSRICDTVEAGDEKMYRYSLDKTVAMIIAKAQNVVQRGLPESLEDRFVTTALEIPVLSVKREESSISISSTVVEGGNTGVHKELEAMVSDTASDSFDSQSTAASSVAASAVFSDISIASSAATAVVVEGTAAAKDEVPSDEVKKLQRLRTAFSFIVASYTSPQLALTLSEELDDFAKSGIDFAPLNQHLDQIQKLKAEATAAHSFSDASRKRGSLEDDEQAELRAEKKRKLEEEEKRRKANQSRGVRDLAKVNVKGMKKMSDFFGKKPSAIT